MKCRVFGVLVAGEAVPVEGFCLEGRDPGLGHRVVQRAASRADGGCGLELVEPVSGGEVVYSGAAIGVSDQAALWLAQAVCHPGRVDHELCSQMRCGLPADDHPAVAIEDEREVDEAVPGAQVGDVGNPFLVRAGRSEVTLQQVTRLLERGLVPLSSTPGPRTHAGTASGICARSRCSPHADRTADRLDPEGLPPLLHIAGHPRRVGSSSCAK